MQLSYARLFQIQTKFMVFAVLSILLIVSVAVLGKAAEIGSCGSFLRDPHQVHVKEPVYAIAWSDDGLFLAVVNSDKLTIFDTEDWHVTSEQSIISRLVLGRSLYFMDDRHVVFGGDGNEDSPRAKNKHALTIWRVIEKGSAGHLPNDDKEGPVFRPQETFSVSQDKKQLVATDIEATSLFSYDLHSDELQWTKALPPGVRPQQPFEPPPLAPLPIQDEFTAFAFAPDNERIAVCTSLGKLFFVNRSGEGLREASQVFPNGTRCTAIRYSYDGAFLAMGREALRPIPIGRQPRPGDVIPFENDSGLVEIWHAGRLREAAPLLGLSGPIRDLAWRPGKRELAIADDANLTVWRSARDGRWENVCKVPGPAYTLAYSSQGRLAIAQSGALTVYKTE